MSKPHIDVTKCETIAQTTANTNLFLQRDTMINHLRHALPVNTQSNMQIIKTQPAIKHNNNRGSTIIDKLCVCVGRDTSRDDNSHHSTDNHTSCSISKPTVRTRRASVEIDCSSPMHTRPVVTSTLGSHSNTIPNMDLICSIADTYELPSDSDTYSYISNCLLNQLSFDSSADRRLRRSHASLSSTIGNDQVYPDHPTSTFRQHSTESHRRGRKRQRYERSGGRQQTGRQHQSVSVIMTESNGSTVVI